MRIIYIMAQEVLEFNIAEYLQFILTTFMIFYRRN